MKMASKGEMPPEFNDSDEEDLDREEPGQEEMQEDDEAEIITA
jgi:hypothetical protein